MVFWSNCSHAERLLDREEIVRGGCLIQNFKSWGGRLLDKRRLFEKESLLPYS